MADAPVPPPPPVAIRITRPYATEEEYLEKELETLTRAGITLLGAQSRPQGVVLRFELVLMSGHVLVRGEGRVLGFKANAFQGIGGLTLRFTRLDSRSKGLIDKAAALREMRRPSSRPPDPLEQYMPRPVPEPAPLPAASDPAIPIAPLSGPTLPDSPPSSSPQVPAIPMPLSSPAVLLPPAPAEVRLVPPAEALAPLAVPPPPARVPPARAAVPRLSELQPGDRDSLLDRLRARARSLDPADVERILSGRDA